MSQKFIDTIYYHQPLKESVLKQFPVEKLRKILHWSHNFISLIIFICILSIIVPWLKYYPTAVAVNNNSQSQAQNDNYLPTIRDNTGQLIIDTPTLKINAPIVEGVKTNSLKQGLGHHNETPWPNRAGNVVIAGHSFDNDLANPFGKVFYNLDKIHLNDLVKISYQQNIYSYQVDLIKTVSPENSEYFNQTQDFRLTFYTCTPVFTNWHRLIVQARLISVENNK
jgi:LPXTG-site transpeptidase (sortase) family protein